MKFEEPEENSDTKNLNLNLNNPFKEIGTEINSEENNYDLEEKNNSSITNEPEIYETKTIETESSISLKHYLMSIVIMPFSLRIVCLTNLFCWMAHVCYSLYFTDFVGEAVFGGNPAVINLN